MKENFRTTFIEHIHVSEFYGSYRVNTPLDPISDVTPCWQLYYIFKGTLHCTAHDKPVTLCKNEMFLFPPGCLREFTEGIPAGVEFGIISFLSNSAALEQISDTLLQAKPEEKELFNSIQLLALDNFEIIPDSDIFRGLRPKSTSSPVVLQRMKNSIEALLLSLYGHLDINHSERNEARSNTLNRDIKFVCEIEAYMTEHLGEQLYIEDIAKHMLCSVSKIKRIFKSVTGHGVKHHFQTLKINRAMELIQNTDYTFSEIADMLGFDSHGYFSQVFKQRTGYTPSEFSKLQK